VSDPEAHSLRFAAVVSGVCAAGVVAAVVAVAELAAARPGLTALLGIAALLGASMAAERFPVPLDGIDTGGITLTFVFGVATIVLFGWAAGVVVFVAAPAIMQLVERRPLVRATFNAAQFGVSAAVAGGLAGLIDGASSGAVAAQVGVAAGAHYAVNVVLITAVVAASERKSFVPSLRRGFRLTIVPFALMASAALVLVVLWQRLPAFSIALAGPLLAIALYQRSTHRALSAMRLALTDPLTGLGNHRHFHERLGQELSDFRVPRPPLSLCLFDVDDFKLVNDRYGHPSGDQVLAALAAALRPAGEAFRLGGDEFGLLLPGVDSLRAQELAAACVERLDALAPARPGIAFTVSVGVATSVGASLSGDELLRRADAALYEAKAEGKDRIHVDAPAPVEAVEAVEAHAAAA
jgi:diguanylate cyclase (GGDEF)-like protein